MNALKRYQDIAGRINYALFLAVVALLPFPQTALRYAWVLWLLSWLFELRWLSIPRSPLRLTRLPFALFALWYGWKALSGLWAADTSAWAWQIERYMSFGLLIPICIWGLNDRFQWQTVARVSVISCIAAVPLYGIWMALLYHHPEWVSALPLTECWTQHESMWLFVSENISHFKHRLFLCSAEICGAYAACKLHRRQWYKLVPALLVMLSAVALTGSRQAILTVIVMAAVGLTAVVPKAYRWRYGVCTVLIGLLAGAVFMKFHPRMQELDMSAFTEMREMSYDHDLRFNIWGAALQHPEDYIVHGLGAGQSRQYLAERYQEAHFNYYAQMQYHAHNQYLEELMELGIGGLLLFLAAWVSIPLCARKKERIPALLFTILFGLNMLTDCMFGKFDGIALWAVGILLLFLQPDTERDEQSSRYAEAH